ncbi:MAG: DNA mismatch repair protein MutS, partial [Corallococcus sp.]|nr:DNA mismatch repair protein MutS [Corallococcus sp.]
MSYSPMMMNYLQTKENYKDCILLYRLGDFYEMFFEDAVKASEILDLVLTGKNCGAAERAPMCGVPYHALDVYVAKLLEAGQKVAVCEQLTDPIPGKIVERDVVRVITPGTVMESEILEDKRNNYIACIYSEETEIGCAFCDLSTGEFGTTQLSGYSTTKELQEILVSFKPSEIICDTKSKNIGDVLDCVKAEYVPTFSVYDTNVFNYSKAQAIVERQYGVSTLDGFGLNGKNLAVIACGALINYLRETQKRELPHLESIRYIDNTD